MKQFLFSIVVFAYYTTSVKSQSALYGQCGGQGWTGLIDLKLPCYFIN